MKEHAGSKSALFYAKPVSRLRGKRRLFIEKLVYKNNPAPEGNFKQAAPRLKLAYFRVKSRLLYIVK